MRILSESFPWIKRLCITLLEETQKTMVVMNQVSAFGIVFLKASFMEIYWLKCKYRKK